MKADDSKQYWRNKLLAFLHDPPTKPLDIPAHETVRETLLRQAGFAIADIQAMERRADWIAAAADRFPFPDHKKSELRSNFTGGADSPFRHPLGGSNYKFPAPFASTTAAEEIIQMVQAGIDLNDVPEDDRDWANYFLHWRRWPVEAAFKDGRTAFLPADTRIPDHNVWCHNSLVSALQGCFESGGKPAFLLFQLGPVQEFIAQARSTRDLWSGSYMLSWLTAHAIKAVTDRFGPDHIIFPSLRGIPLFDLLHKKCIYDVARYQGRNGREDTLWERMNLSYEAVLTPALPNRFLALVPAGDRGVDIAKAAAKAAGDAFKGIASDCWKWFANHGHPLEDACLERFDQQIADFLNVSWQVTSWCDEPAKRLVEAYRRMYDSPSPGAESLAAVYDVATRVVPEQGHADDWIVKQGELNSPGFAWAYEYARVARTLDARHQLRDFKPWPTDPHGSPKDSLSGKEEVVGDEEWWKKLAKKAPFVFYFRSKDRFGAVNLCKKIWHIAHLEQRFGLKVKTALQFESVPGVAAGKWRKDFVKRLADPDYDVFMAHAQRLRDAIEQHSETAGIEIKELGDRETLALWIQRNDPEIFCDGAWTANKNGLPESDIPEVLTILREHGDINGKNQRLLPSPPSTFAVLALDGDEMGKWIGGDNTPELFGQFSKEAQGYFEKIGTRKALGIHRPVSPAYHLQFSEALSNFALYLVRPIIEHFGGQLIYAGGDDVLAMLPASEALRCAQGLRAAFRGKQRLCALVPNTFEVLGSQGGFVKVQPPSDGLADGQPTWPLIVPGPRADVSVGIAMAHAHSPLQNVVRAAQAAEKRAKNRYGRKAFAVTLYKRSGETIEWGGRWDSGALDAYDAFLDCWRGNPEHPKFLSGGFPHALVALLSPYELDTSAPGRRTDMEGFPFQDVILQELDHTISRQSDKKAFSDKNPQKDANDKRIVDFVSKTKKWLDTLCANGRRPLPDFANLFRVAAFLERGE